VVGLGQWCMGQQMMDFMGWQKEAHVMLFSFFLFFFGLVLLDNLHIILTA
jgi:hypothetical protein